jgi:hypothetical protein
MLRFPRPQCHPPPALEDLDLVSSYPCASIVVTTLNPVPVTSLASHLVLCYHHSSKNLTNLIKNQLIPQNSPSYSLGMVSQLDLFAASKDETANQP